MICSVPFSTSGRDPRTGASMYMPPLSATVCARALLSLGAAGTGMQADSKAFFHYISSSNKRLNRPTCTCACSLAFLQAV
jgi:hypothetical protein